MPRDKDCGLVLVGGHFPPEVHKTLKMIALEEGITLRDLLGEAFAGVFETYGYSKLAEIARNPVATIKLKKRKGKS